MIHLLRSSAGQERNGGWTSGEATQRAITAFLVGLKSRSAALSMQRSVNEYPGEPLTAILPGATLQEVWEIVGRGGERPCSRYRGWWSSLVLPACWSRCSPA